MILTDILLSLIPVKEPLDYQGRTFMHVPQDVGVNLKSEFPPEKCFLPKKLIHTWTGHSKGKYQDFIFNACNNYSSTY